MSRTLGCLGSLALATLLGCGDDDAALADAAPHDAAPHDAAPHDASGLCDGVGQQLFTGDYVDWDSTNTDFLGVFQAEVFPEGQPERAVRTAPNGRSLLCVGTNDLDVRFVHPDYLDARFAVDITASADVGYTVRGLTPARAVTLLTDELSLTFEPTAALVIVDLRQPDGAPFTGATLAIAASAGGVFTTDETGAWVSGGRQQAGGDGRVLFANVAPGAGQTALTIDPGVGVSCDVRAALPLGAGAVTHTLAVCR